MLLCTIVENGANASFCRESGECHNYALFLFVFYSEITQKNRILAEFWQRFCLKNWPLEALRDVDIFAIYLANNKLNTVV